MSHTPSSMDVGSIIHVSTAPIWPHKWYWIGLRWISSAITTSWPYWVMNTPTELAYLCAFKMCIIGHTPLIMDAGCIRHVSTAPIWTYKWYGTGLHWISTAITISWNYFVLDTPTKLAWICEFKMGVTSDTPLSMDAGYVRNFSTDPLWP